jgi:hypothetical protein
MQLILAIKVKTVLYGQRNFTGNESMDIGFLQKQLLQQLRKELEANSTNSTLNVKSVAMSLGFISNQKSRDRTPCT